MTARDDLTSLLTEMKDDPNTPKDERDEALNILIVMTSPQAESSYQTLFNPYKNAPKIIQTIMGLAHKHGDRFLGSAAFPTIVCLWSLCMILFLYSFANIGRTIPHSQNSLAPAIENIHIGYLGIVLAILSIGSALLYFSPLMPKTWEKKNREGIYYVAYLIRPRAILKGKNSYAYRQLIKQIRKDYCKANPTRKVDLKSLKTELSILAERARHRDADTRSEIVAKSITEHRIAKNMTQAHLAEACGLNVRTIQRLEKSGEASAETLSAVASVLDLPQKPYETQTATRPIRENVLKPGLIAILTALLLTGIDESIPGNYENPAAALYGTFYLQNHIIIALANITTAAIWSAVISLIFSSILKVYSLDVEKKEKKSLKIIRICAAIAIPWATVTGSCVLNMIVLNDIAYMNLTRNNIHMALLSQIADNQDKSPDDKRCVQLVDFYGTLNMQDDPDEKTRRMPITEDPTLSMMAARTPELYAKNLSKLWAAYPILTGKGGPWPMLQDRNAYEKTITHCLSLATKH